MSRCILHVDCNCFYASVEMLHHPETRTQPMAVAGDPESRRGIILAKNDLAKHFGVTTGEAVWVAKQKCPDLLLLPPHFAQYTDFSHRVKQIFADYTDQIESFGIDEAWLDVTGSTQLFGSGEQIAHTIRRRVKQELGITVSVGVSWNKIFAKLGSDLKKPDAVSVITQENFHRVVWPLPASALLGVGRATSQKLTQLGIHTIGDLAHSSRELLRRQLGKSGEQLWVYANGLDNSHVALHDEHEPVKSISNSTTTSRDMTNAEDGRLVLTVLAESVAARLREQQLSCRTVTVSIRTNRLATSDFQCALPYPSSETALILDTAVRLLETHCNWSVPLRSIGIQLSNLCSADEPVQLNFFHDSHDMMRQNALDHSIDRIRNRFGNTSVLRASVLLDPSLTGFDLKHQHEMHPVD